jgi:hypothetical protein
MCSDFKSKKVKRKSKERKKDILKNPNIEKAKVL